MTRNLILMSHDEFLAIQNPDYNSRTSQYIDQECCCVSFRKFEIQCTLHNYIFLHFSQITIGENRSVEGGLNHYVY